MQPYMQLQPMYGYAGGYAGIDGCGCGIRGGMGAQDQGAKPLLVLVGLGLAMWFLLPKGGR
jgi:hypothetical protein